MSGCLSRNGASCALLCCKLWCVCGKDGAGTRPFQANLNEQGIRTILQTFEALATELETRRSRGQSKPRQLHCKPQRPVADPTYSLMPERKCQYGSALNRKSRGAKNGRLHDLMHVTITVAWELWSYHKRLLLSWKRRRVGLTSEEAFFLFPPVGSRQWRTWAFVVCR